MYDDPNSMWCAWKNIFSNVIDRHAPLRTKRVRSSKSPWITSHLKLRMHERDIKKCRNSVNNEIKQAKEIYYKNVFHENEGNSRKTWSIINELTARKSNNLLIKEIKLKLPVVLGL